MSRQIIPYNAQLMRDHGKTSGWERKSGNLILFQEDKGYYTHHVIVEENGIPLWDQIVNAERGGGVFLPEDGNGKFGLQRMWRPQTRDMEKYQRDFPAFSYADLGRTPMECPRGFAKIKETGDNSIVREAEEETEGSLVSHAKLPDICGNSTFDPHMTSLAYGTVDLSKKPKNRPDPNDGIIAKIQFYSISEMAEMRRSGELYDTFTLAAFAARILEEPEKFFREELLA